MSGIDFYFVRGMLLFLAVRRHSHQCPDRTAWYNNFIRNDTKSPYMDRPWKEIEIRGGGSGYCYLERDDHGPHKGRSGPSQVGDVRAICDLLSPNGARGNKESQRKS